MSVSATSGPRGAHGFGVLAWPIRRLLSIGIQPSVRTSLILSSLLFVGFSVFYIGASTVRSRRAAANHTEERVTPTVTQIADGFKRVAFQKDLTKRYRLWVDMAASMRRFMIALAFIFTGAILGANMGVLPYVESIFLRPLMFGDKVPAIAIFPILMCVFGTGEAAKILLIILGVFPTVALATFLDAKAVPRELILKGQTLGASNFEVVYRIVWPNIWPNIQNTLRSNFKSMLALLLAGEMLISSVGFGFRILISQRTTAMDIIIPYVLFMSALVFVADYAMKLWIAKRYPWFGRD